VYVSQDGVDARPHRLQPRRSLLARLGEGAKSLSKCGLAGGPHHTNPLRSHHERLRTSATR
jgi:hypothetical protein